MTVSYSPCSLRDLEGIRDFTTVESKDPLAANQYSASILNAGDVLAMLPERYPPYRYATGWRMMPFENYPVFFQVRDNDVRIGHVRHGVRTPFRGNAQKEKETPSA